MSGRGMGRGRGKKRANTGTAAAPSGATDADLKAADHHSSRSLMLATPIGTLMRIEATIWMSARGAGSVSLDDFYALARTHEWLGAGQHNVKSNGARADEQKMAAPTAMPRPLSELCNGVYELMGQLKEEERLLFDFVAVSAWRPTDLPGIYQLYRLQPSSRSNKVQLEIMQQPKKGVSPDKPATSDTKIATRSEVLGNMYHLSHKCFSFGGTADKPSVFHNWWEHAKNVAQMILDNRESMVAATASGKVDNNGGKASLKSPTDSTASKSPTKSNGDTKKMTLEERVRARSLRNPTAAKPRQKSQAGGESSQDSENKILLELADALRSYSQRRGLASPAGAGGSALERLKNRGATGGGSSTHATKNIARLTVLDLMKDARISWNAIVNESIDRHDNSGGTKSTRGRGSKMVNIDLGRVMFQLRLKNVSDKRQMELQLLNLLEKLATLAPAWIHLRRAPTTLAGNTKKDAATSAGKLNIRQSIIVIRNDAVDFAVDVRAKLGGRVHNRTKGNGRSKSVGAAKGTKRSLQQVEEQQRPNKKMQGHVGVADAIVPPSFERIYGKALVQKDYGKDGK